MAKIRQRYLEIDPWAIEERTFHIDRAQVSESLFSLGNEYSGVRGFFEEGGSFPSLVGTYYNGVIEYGLEDIPNAYKGISKRTHFTINSTNYLKISLEVGGERLDLGKAKHHGFLRRLSLRDGLLTRSFVWETRVGEVRLSFARLLSMECPHEAVQRIALSGPLGAEVRLSFFLDGNILHWGDHCYWDRGFERATHDRDYLFLKTPTTHQSLLTAMEIDSPFEGKSSSLKRECRRDYAFCFDENPVVFTRYVIALADKHSDDEGKKIAQANRELNELVAKGFDGVREANEDFFRVLYGNSDIQIDGNDEDQQGIRFCLFQLAQAYSGREEDNNIGAKGLTGEAYSGHAFWDSETYCLPYYLFSNPKAAKNLLLFRYHTLEQAKRRARDLDCTGACFPIATRNGEEACTLWQHASTQIQPTSAVAYAIFHYMNLFDDEDFMRNYGLRMLLEIGKFLFSRGQWNADHTAFGYYGVMGPDEFQVMVNHNAYTNYMGKRMMGYILDVALSPRFKDDGLLLELGYDDAYIAAMKEAIEAMRIPFDEKTLLFEQHVGYFDLPHIDVDKIPVEEFPLYAHWSYDRIYRNDMIKQPDVLMFMFLFPSSFPLAVKKANYEFYEPRCIHESSLSPSVHSIIAEEIGKEKEALDFFSFATRLDLDDYNRNTSEGLHMTSIAAAWVNIVYGFLGLRSDGPMLAIHPKIPNTWKHYSCKLLYRKAKLTVDVYPKRFVVRNDGEPVDLLIGEEAVHLVNECERSL